MSSIDIPKRLPVLLVDRGIVFPSTHVALPVVDEQNVATITKCMNDADLQRRPIIALAYRTPDGRRSTVGTAALINRVVVTTSPAGEQTYVLNMYGLCRVKFEREINGENDVGEGVVLKLCTPVDRLNKKEEHSPTSDDKLFIDGLLTVAQNALKTKSNTRLAQQIISNIATSAPLDVLTDRCVNLFSSISYSDRLSLLENHNEYDRVKVLLKFIDSTLARINDEQKEYKETVTTVQVYAPKEKKENEKNDANKIFSSMLSGEKEKTDEKEKLRLAIQNAGMPKDTLDVVMAEFEKYTSLPPQSHEHAPIRAYLTLMTQLPWNVSTPDTSNLVDARRQLDEDHYALDDVKKRILEYLAVRVMEKENSKGRREHNSTILCLVGPPGVGKTSIAASIAKTMNRQFQRISLGGISDESDIRGHRRTYIGSMPGRIIQALKRCRVNNPVCLLDEIDKLTRGTHGDPNAALLELLDPEQNHTFVDHYVNCPFDVSNVLFVATANNVADIPPPLRDRMDIVQLDGYTHEEKMHIARTHLVDKQLEKHSLRRDQVVIDDEAISTMISSYTREAGVRSLQRCLARVCRNVALRIVSETEMSLHQICVNSESLEEMLGQALYVDDEYDKRETPIGVAIGLAWTPVGGALMHIEAALTPNGSGKLKLTGKLGDVMTESCRVALTWIAANCQFQHDLLSTHDVHIHMPSGAIGKDGPSAGVAIVVALLSRLNNQSVKREIAMTGEISLRGRVLPVGGVVAKVLAAHRNGITKVILPTFNKRDIGKLPENVRDKIEFVYVTRIEECIKHAFGDNNFVPLPICKL